MPSALRDGPSGMELSLVGRWPWKQGAVAPRDPLRRSDAAGVWVGTLPLQTALRAIVVGVASQVFKEMGLQELFASVPDYIVHSFSDYY